MWIREYQKASINCLGFQQTDVPKAVWFLEENGFSQKEPAEFQRFVTVQSGLYWNESSFIPANNPVWSGGEKTFHEIGIASFAKTENTANLYYFDYVWGGRFGKDWQVDLSGNFENAVWTEIWIS